MDPSLLSCWLSTDLVVKAGTLAVAVDEVRAHGTNAEDGEADEEGDASMHAHVHPRSHVDALLAVGHIDGRHKADSSEHVLHIDYLVVKA